MGIPGPATTETVMPEAQWSLHPQLASAAVTIGDLALSRLGVFGGREARE